MTIRHDLPHVEASTSRSSYPNDPHEQPPRVTEDLHDIAKTQARPNAHRLGDFTLNSLLKSMEHPAPSKQQPEFVTGLAEENLDGIRQAEIENDPLLDSVPRHSRAEVAANTYELYRAAKEKVAPVVTGFADSLLQEAGEEQIVFVARDGLGAFHAATILKGKFDYNNNDPDQLVFAYLTRSIVLTTPREVLIEYLEQAGVHNATAEILLADIGMYGTILRDMREVLPNMKPRFLISKTPEVPGYADGESKQMTSVRWVPGNPAVHFLEDTFSGPIPSPKSLVHSEAGYVPDTISESFPPEEMLKRKYAIKAIEDYAANLNSRPSQPMAAVNDLDLFLADTDRYKHLMVPHHR